MAKEGGRQVRSGASSRLKIEGKRKALAVFLEKLSPALILQTSKDSEPAMLRILDASSQR